MEDFQNEMEIEWKKIASMEYKKLYSIPYHALMTARRRVAKNLQ